MDREPPHADTELEARHKIIREVIGRLRAAKPVLEVGIRVVVGAGEQGGATRGFSHGQEERPTGPDRFTRLRPIRELRLGEWMDIGIKVPRTGCLHPVNLGTSGFPHRLFASSWKGGEWPPGIPVDRDFANQWFFVGEDGKPVFPIGESYSYQETGDQFGKANGRKEGFLALLLEDGFRLKAGHLHEAWEHTSSCRGDSGPSSGSGSTGWENGGGKPLMSDDFYARFAKSNGAWGWLEIPVV